MSEETFGFTEEELKKLEKASDEWNICSEKTGRIWKLFLNDDEYNDTEGENDLIPYRQYLMQRWIIINRSQYKGADRHKLVMFFNSHDGSSGVKVAMTPVRVVCQNTLNLALGTAKRIWTARHTENVLLRVQDARETLQLANSYMGELGKGIHELTTIKLSDRKVQEFINEFFPVAEDLTDGQRKNNLRLQEDLKARYYNAPDLEWVGKNGWRFINAVSDFATHADPLRKTKNYNENLFLRTAEGNPMIDKAYKMVLAAA